ncbi:MAG: arylsulfatase [Cyclobacteriaceae bacterium]|nr:arylsulfatase [Cyclobacteriaceae bacterium SS2]
MKRRITCLVFLLALISACSHQQEEAVKPNILLIVADDLGYSDLGCYGGEISTPNLDLLAKEGVLFTNFYSTGRCCPSRASLLIGEYSHMVGLGHMTNDLDLPGYRGRVPENQQTIGSLLKSIGYHTYLAGKWHLGTPDPTKFGFDEFYGTLTSAKTYWDPEHFLRLPENREQLKLKEETFYGTNALTEYALSFMNEGRNSQDPWFLYLAYNAPHFPLQAPREYVEKYIKVYEKGWGLIREERFKKMMTLGILDDNVELTYASEYHGWGTSTPQPNPEWGALTPERKSDLSRRMAIYAAMVEIMDQNIGRVIQELKNSGELENTLVIFTSDNGACAEWDPFGFDMKSGPENILHKEDALESMGSQETFHSVGSGWAHVSNTPLRLYKHFNHEGGIRVPLILRWGEGGNRAERMNGHLIDILPTIMSVSGRNSFPLKETEGINLIEAIKNDENINRTLFFEHEGNRAVIQNNWKLVALRDRSWELYNLASDPTESENLALIFPSKIKQMIPLWENWAKANNVLPMPIDYRVDYLE